MSSIDVYQCGFLTFMCQYLLNFSDIVKNHESLSSKIIIKYDDKGNIIESNYYRADGSLSSKATYSYDDKGNINIIESNYYNAHGIEKETYKYEFDEKGNWIEKIMFINQYPVSIEERKYEYYK